MTGRWRGRRRRLSFHWERECRQRRLFPREINRTCATLCLSELKTITAHSPCRASGGGYRSWRSPGGAGVFSRGGRHLAPLPWSGLASFHVFEHRGTNCGELLQDLLKRWKINISSDTNLSGKCLHAFKYRISYRCAGILAAMNCLNGAGEFPRWMEWMKPVLRERNLFDWCQSANQEERPFPFFFLRRTQVKDITAHGLICQKPNFHRLLTKRCVRLHTLWFR